MSRRKDRERFFTMKNLNSEYQGFRGFGQGTPSVQASSLQAITCSKCGRRRNVSAEIALEQADSYICLSCREETVANTPVEKLPEEPAKS